MCSITLSQDVGSQSELLNDLFIKFTLMIRQIPFLTLLLLPPVLQTHQRQSFNDVCLMPDSVMCFPYNQVPPQLQL